MLQVRALLASPPPYKCMGEKRGESHVTLPYLYEVRFFGTEGPAVFPFRLCTKCMEELIKQAQAIHRDHDVVRVIDIWFPVIVRSR